MAECLLTMHKVLGLILCTSKNKAGTSNMAHCVIILVAKADDPSLIPRTHIVEEEN